MEILCDFPSSLREMVNPLTGRFCLDEKASVAPESSRNAVLLGDNLDALKLLQERENPILREGVKLLYVDPPYNTGHTHVFRDDFRGDQGAAPSLNLCRWAHSHGAWMEMLYPRLRLAWGRLREDGCACVSVDDFEVCRMRLLLDAVFGSENYVSTFVWRRGYAPKNSAKYVSSSHEYVLMYAKNKEFFRVGRPPMRDITRWSYTNPDDDPRGAWRAGSMSGARYYPDGDYPIENPLGGLSYPPQGRSWRFSRPTYDKLLADNRIAFCGTTGSPRYKRFLAEHAGTRTPESMFATEDVGYTETGTKELKTLFGGYAVFSYPKPLKLMRHLMLLAGVLADDVVLDIFAGSGTLGHAVFEANADDDGSRTYIGMQQYETIPPNTAAYLAGYRCISEVTLERLRRASARVENADVNTGFRVFRRVAPFADE